MGGIRRCPRPINHVPRLFAPRVCSRHRCFQTALNRLSSYPRSSCMWKIWLIPSVPVDSIPENHAREVLIPATSSSICYNVQPACSICSATRRGLIGNAVIGARWPVFRKQHTYLADSLSMFPRKGSVAEDRSVSAIAFFFFLKAVRHSYPE